MVEKVSQQTHTHAPQQTQTPSEAELKAKAQKLTQKVLPLIRDASVHGVNGLPTFSKAAPNHSLTNRAETVFNKTDTTRPGDHQFSTKAPKEAKDVESARKGIV